MTELELIFMVQHYSLIPELLVEACLLNVDLKVSAVNISEVTGNKLVTQSRLGISCDESSWVCQTS
jgi:hypothetical protein